MNLLWKWLRITKIHFLVFCMPPKLIWTTIKSRLDPQAVACNNDIITLCQELKAEIWLKNVVFPSLWLDRSMLGNSWGFGRFGGGPWGQQSWGSVGNSVQSDAIESTLQRWHIQQNCSRSSGGMQFQGNARLLRLSHNLQVGLKRAVLASEVAG